MKNFRNILKRLNLKHSVYDEIDNVAWSMSEKEITSWCQENKVFDEMTEAQTEEFWSGEATVDGNSIRLNAKNVRESVKRVCHFGYSHGKQNRFVTFG